MTNIKPGKVCKRHDEFTFTGEINGNLIISEEEYEEQPSLTDLMNKLLELILHLSIERISDEKSGE